MSEHRDQLKTRTYLPDVGVVKICQDKFASYETWARAGIRVPRTILLQNLADLKKAFRVLGTPLWVRETTGAFGKNSVPTARLEFARQWIDFHRGWGHFSAAEYLSPHSITWQSIWRHGELVVAQGRKRLYWEFSNRSPSGITGVTGTGVTVSDPVVDEIALKSIQAIDPCPHGIFSVDLTYDSDGVPNPTEINIGRFFTTHLFFSAAGLNMPYIFVKIALDEEPPPISKRINPLPPGLAWVRGMDIEPVLTTVAEIDADEVRLGDLRNRRRKRQD
jgi:carbamoyl-phosphate synthase large subunit